MDLFAGCGGLSDGFEATREFRGLAHVEWEAAPLATLVLRLKKKWGYKRGDFEAVQFDMQNIGELINGAPRGPEGFLGLKNLVDQTVDLVIGGPPCQAYSIAGRIRDANGMQDDYRNFLFESYIEILKWAKPKAFLFENVQGILSAAPGGVPIVDRIRHAFTESGYVVPLRFKDCLFRLEDFGVPQRRSRVFIVGVRRDLFESDGSAAIALGEFYQTFRREYHVDRPVAAREALSGLPPLYPTNDPILLKRRISHQPIISNITSHTPRFHNKRDTETFKILAADLASGEGRYSSIESLKELYSHRTGKKSAVHKYHVIRPEEPSNTIPSHLCKDGLRHIHWDPEQCRSLTVREAARLQTFDDDFEFCGSRSEQYKMVGNAVPPLFAKKIAMHMSKFFIRYDFFNKVLKGSRIINTTPDSFSADVSDLKT